MAPEDMREDLIDNEPIDCIDDTGVEEKTWSWFVVCCLQPKRVVIDFL